MNTRILDTTKKNDVKIFKSLPFELFKGNRFWVPPVPGEIEFVMDREHHPFYVHSEADFIIVESGKQILGRLAVLHNKNYCNFHKINTALFFYYESVEDQQVANLLFSAAEDWCKKRGINEIYGPRGFLRSNCIGLLVEGFDQEPATGMTYNLPYYQDQLAACGFIKHSDHYSGIIDAHIDRKIHTIGKKVLSRGKFRVQSFRTTAEMVPWIPRLDEVHHRAFANNADFMPSTQAEFDLLARNIITLVEPRFVKLILYEEQVAGFLITFPNLNRGLRFAKGRLFPLGWLGLWLDKKFSNVIDLEGVGLLPEYQGLGGNAVLYSEIDKVLQGARFKRGELVQVDERNRRSKSDAETMKVTWNKTHRTFKKAF